LAIVRWNPTTDLAGLHSAMDRLFGDVFGEMFTVPAQSGEGNGDRESSPPELPTYHLPVNISETENGYRIEAPVPGFRPEDVEVTFSEGVLTISARRTEERTREEGSYLRREVAFGNYRRHITLPGDIRAEDIRAAFENGVLTVEVPRAPKPEPKRIQIRPGERQSKEQQSQLAGSGARKS
jgi:HSP20 family protein